MTSNGLVMRSQHCSHFTKEGSSHNMEKRDPSPSIEKWFLVVHVLLSTLQRRYSGNGVKGTIMLIIGHCTSSKNAFLQMHHWGFMSYNKTYLNLCMQLFFSSFLSTLLSVILIMKFNVFIIYLYSMNLKVIIYINNNIH